MIALYHLASVKLFVAPCGPEPLGATKSFTLARW